MNSIPIIDPNIYSTLNDTDKNTIMMLLNIHGHRTQGQTHQVEGVEADLRQNDTVSSVGVVGGRFDVSMIKVLQIQ